MWFKYNGSYIELYSDKLCYNEVVGYRLYTHRIGRKALEIICWLLQGEVYDTWELPAPTRPGGD